MTRSSSSIPRYASGNTTAEKNHQVGERMAKMTGKGGLIRSQLTKNKRGQWVSKLKSQIGKKNYRENKDHPFR